MSIRTILVILTVLLVAVLIWTFFSSSTSSQLANAYKRYTEGERSTTVSVRQEAFNESLEIYTSLEKSYHPRFGNGKLYYNIANCFFQLGQYPWAIYYYDMAQALRPRDSKVTHNLQIAQTKLGIPIDKNELKGVSKYVSLPELLQLFFLFSLFAFAFASIQIWSYSPLWEKISLFFGILSTIIFLNLIYLHYFGALEGVIVNAAPLYRDAGEQYAKVSEKPLLPGVKVSILDTQNNGTWLKVQTPQGDLGFIQKDTLRVIDTQ